MLILIDSFVIFMYNYLQMKAFQMWFDKVLQLLCEFIITRRLLSIRYIG